MKKKSLVSLLVAIVFLSLFILWTVLLCFVNVKAIGPNGSKVGFAGLNSAINQLIGAHFTLYIITDWLGLVPFAIVFCFAILGLIQLVKRKGIFKVDADILLLGGFYIVVFATYVLFEYLVINYRPVLINGYLEASYPSSTTMLVTCVMPTAIIQLNRRVKKRLLKKIFELLISLFIAFMVIGRFVSGVHWFSDILGGLLYSIGMVVLYCSVLSIIE